MPDDLASQPLPPLPHGFDIEHDLDDIYDWLPKQCNDAVLGDLISLIQDRDPRAKKEILKSGNIDHKVRMLRRAVGYGFLQKEELARLLHRCEESGQQWIYLYKPEEEYLDTVSNPEKIREDLEAYGTELQYPEIRINSNKTAWVDFRVTSTPANKKDWVLKVYEHIRFHKKLASGAESVNDDTYREWVEYQFHDAYLVHVVRWRSGLGLLEVRIDKEKSFGRKSAQESRLNGVVDFLQPAIPINSITAWSLQDRCTNLLINRRSKKDLLNFGHVRIETEDEGKANIFPGDSKIPLDEDEGRSKAIDNFLQGGGKPLEVCINFKVLEGLGRPNAVKKEVDSESAKDDELRTIVNGKFWNVVSISSRISPELLDHVINSLCTSH